MSESKQNYHPGTGFILLFSFTLLSAYGAYWLTALTNAELSDQYMKDGIEHNIKGHYKKALSSFLKSTELTHDNPRYQTQRYLITAVMAIKLNKFDQARELFQTALGLSPKDINTRSEIIQFLELSDEKQKNALFINEIKQLLTAEDMDFIIEAAKTLIKKASTDNEKKALINLFSQDIQQKLEQNPL